MFTSNSFSSQYKITKWIFIVLNDQLRLFTYCSLAGKELNSLRCKNDLYSAHLRSWKFSSVLQCNYFVRYLLITDALHVRLFLMCFLEFNLIFNFFSIWILSV